MFLQECALQFEVCLRLVLPIPHHLPIGISYAIFLKFTILNLNKKKTKTGLILTPQRLREWFCCEMVSKGVSDSCVGSFCGRIPRSILAKHYLDYSPERMKEIYDKANLSVLN